MRKAKHQRNRDISVSSGILQPRTAWAIFAKASKNTWHIAWFIATGVTTCTMLQIKWIICIFEIIEHFTNSAAEKNEPMDFIHCYWQLYLWSKHKSLKPEGEYFRKKQSRNSVRIDTKLTSCNLFTTPATRSWNYDNLSPWSILIGLPPCSHEIWTSVWAALKKNWRSPVFSRICFQKKKTNHLKTESSSVTN